MEENKTICQLCIWHTQKNKGRMLCKCTEFTSIWDTVNAKIQDRKVLEIVFKKLDRDILQSGRGVEVCAPIVASVTDMCEHFSEEQQDTE